MKAFIETERDIEHTQTTPFDIIVDGKTPGDDPEKAAEIVGAWQAAGATWWIEALWDISEDNLVLERIRQGPPA